MSKKSIALSSGQLQDLLEKAENRTSELQQQLDKIKSRINWLQQESASLEYPAQGDENAALRLETIQADLRQLEKDAGKTEQAIKVAESEQETLKADLEAALLIEAAGQAKRAELEAARCWLTFYNYQLKAESARADFAGFMEQANEAAAEVRQRGGHHPGFSMPLGSDENKRDFFERRVQELSGEKQPEPVPA